MLHEARRVSVAFVVVVLALNLSAGVFAVQKKKDKEPPRGTPVLWRAMNVEALDLRAGPGGAGGGPSLRRVQFLEEEKGGFSTKYRVKDAAGREWVVKVGKEAQSETAATRLLWAAGYMTEATYLVPRVNIRGKGVFRNARFEGRGAGVKREGEWGWDENPFVGTREFQGLKVMMVFLNNWDIKDSNNVILSQGGELRYAISDLGATLGETGRYPLLWRFTRNRNNPEGFGDDKFIDEIKDDGRVDFHFSGKKRGMFNDIRVEDARWLGQQLARLSDRQIGDAFRAANYTPAEVRVLTRAVRARINELVRLPSLAAR
ncbi:MAG TPA: hypothetical protein VE360_00205 [Pyrinomonadaceae bacterium]|nr:hypothetical protein [Pyrinomonadaceae bacterium]